jgi:hypothetical protein
MTIQINIGDRISATPSFVAFPARHLGTMRWARKRALAVSVGMPSANVYFRGITAGARSLSEILADSNMWVHFHPTLVDFGVTPGAAGFATECAIGPAAFRGGRWVVLATLIHELAHCNGAPGGGSTVAEDALPHCGLGTMAELRTGVDNPRTPYQPGLGG